MPAAVVLIVEQDWLNLTHLRTVLQEEGYTPLSISRASLTALTELPENVQLLLLPLDESPESLAAYQPFIERFAAVPVLVLLAGLAPMSQALQAVIAKADDYVFDPEHYPDLLVHKVRLTLERRALVEHHQQQQEQLRAINQDLKRHLDELETDQLAGRHTQLRLLPESLVSDGVHCTYHITPSLLLSGDFLDFFELPQQRLAFYIADVSGHGASSAFVTVLLKNLTYRLRRNVKRGSSDELLHPSQVMARMNAELLESSLDKHLTMFYGVLDTQQLTLHYSVGGHFPMPVLVQNGQSEYLAGNGMAIGLFPEAQYSDYRVQLSDSFQLMLFSDGILEILEGASLSDKETKLLNLAQQSGGDLPELVRLLGLDVRKNVPDDIAMLAIARS